MAAIVSATVVRWAVDQDTQPPTVQYLSSEYNYIYCDGSDAEVSSAIIAAYILQKPEGEHAELLADARDGLLEVVGIYRLNVNPPPVPPQRPPHGGGKKAKGARQAV
jgi:hypothetical protein